MAKSESVDVAREGIQTISSTQKIEVEGGDVSLLTSPVGYVYEPGSIPTRIAEEVPEKMSSSASFEERSVANRYKITIDQARRLALRAIERAKQRIRQQLSND